MKRFVLTIVLIQVLAINMYAVSPLWMRYAAISPDGSEIAFSYKGDIYKVSSMGGQAVQLTTQSSYERNIVWSPDGRLIAFASDRKGNFDVFVMSSSGGTPKRLTSNSASELPWAFSPDGKEIYFSAAIQDPASSAMFPSGRMTELYKVPVEGGRAVQVLGTPAEAVHMASNGKFFLYQDQKGMEDALRKHHTSSVTRDIWSYDIATGRHTNLTKHAGEDRDPVLGPDGNTVYMLSERDGGSFNVWKFPLNNPSSFTAVTNFKTHPVRFLTIARDGTLCYTQDGALYTQRQGGQPQRVNIDLFHDDSDQITNFSKTSGASSAIVSPDGKQVAFVVRGEVFVASVEYGTTKRITNTPQAERGITWGSDNRTLVYASERNGNWQLVKATIARKDDPNFPNATTINEEILLPSSTIERAMPDISPDGKKLAFIEDRTKLMVMDIKSGKVHQVTDGSLWYETNGGFGYSWSPDSKWIALEFIGNQRDPYTDIGIVSADGGPITNITASGYFSESPQWVMGGNAIMFKSNRFGMRSHASWGSQDDVLLCFVNQDAYDKYRLSKEDYELVKELEKEQKKKEEEDKAKSDSKKKKKEDKAEEKKEEKKDVPVELDGIEDRIVRLTPNSSDIASAMVTDDGESLYYLSQVEKGYDLWKLDMRKHTTKLINKMGAGSANIQSDKEGKNFFILGSKTMQKLTISGDKLTPITYKAEIKMDLPAEREYMFEHVHRQIDKRFYNLNYHGVNWEAMTTDYRKFLPHINNNYDFADLLSEYLGELNVSHTGGHFYPSGSNEPTARLGLLFDWQYTGQGLKVDEVIERGPFARATSKVRRGTILEMINCTVIDGENDYTTLLNGQVGKKTLVSLYNPSTGERWEEVVLPINNSTMNDLLYRRWVKHNAHVVDSLSGGRLGYVHIRSMGDDSYREVYSQVMGKYYKKDGIVIDIRFNGGGRLHEDIEVLFSGKKYFTQVIRGREACDMPSRRWNKPSIMVQCEACYSNAHGTPWVYSHTGIGKLVGAPVPGTMTSVSWETLQDDSLIFGIPIIGYRLPDGSYLENSQLEPDILVLNDPAEVVKGEDAQLKTAVSELLREIDNQ
ncbi:MAG: PD40 domain-containing protein [Muribaculaceae bacterium]|nr:PD40 domain-containing protein [Muribaculaceae bacterium]